MITYRSLLLSTIILNDEYTIKLNRYMVKILQWTNIIH